ncbi:MAG: hypothetical protein IT204_00410 [Fimbriimonadaceae bacterium]|nr:hypothetical protein [Fimbriimonadaceae bacterium]
MTFCQAVAMAPGLEDACRPGLQAMGANSRHVRCDNTQEFTGSVDLDSAVAAAQPQASRWDYGVGLRRQNVEVAAWIEVHPANSNSVEDVLRKLRWLQDWLRTKACDLGRLTQSYHWVATGRVAWSANSPQRRKLAAAGLKFSSSPLIL